MTSGALWTRIGPFTFDFAQGEWARLVERFSAMGLELEDYVNNVLKTPDQLEQILRR
jgi:hypothetical protein